MEELGRERLLSSSIVRSERHELEWRYSPSSKDSKPFIFRIPDLFKMRNEQACTPYKFSIGPWHVGETQLSRTGQILKESIFEELINRFPDPAAKKRELEEIIEQIHDRAGKCYEGEDVYDEREKLDGSKKNFQKMLLLDGCFIIELMRMRSHPDLFLGDFYKFILLVLFSRAFYQIILHDLLVLDNQIPWFVLENLFDRTKDNSSLSHLSLVSLTANFFCPAISPDPYKYQLPLDSDISHLVDFVRCCWVLSVLPPNSSRYFGWDNEHSLPSATRLKEAGVKFQKVDSTGILDVTFDSNKGVLKIPRLRITPVTQTIFRNVIIFEQCVDCIPYVTGYVVLLDCLIDTSDDMALMSKAEILDNWLSRKETTNLFNRVRNNTLLSVFVYAPICSEVNKYCKRRWSWLRASLIRNHFTKLWAIVSAVYATIHLFFTIMQVFYK